MNCFVDLDKKRKINQLIHQLGCLIEDNPSFIQRTFEYLKGDEMPKHADGSTTVSVRFPNELLKWIDSYSRIVAVNREIRTTRNSTIINFLELMKGIFEERSKTEWDGRTHIEEMKRVIEQVHKREQEQIEQDNKLKI